MGERIDVEMRFETVPGRSPERLGFFSDAVIAVINTIMVLELKAPGLRLAPPGRARS